MAEFLRITTGGQSVTTSGSSQVFKLPLLDTAGAFSTPAQLTVATVNGSAISTVTISTPGLYTRLPVGNSVFAVGGSGSGAYFKVHYGLVSVAVNTGGSGFTSAPTVAVTGSDGTGATVTPTMGVATAAIGSPGTGGTTGTQTVTGTTGTGTKFTASVTVAGGAITAVLSVLTPGSYTVLPTSSTAEPVTGGALTGATLNLTYLVSTIAVTTPGSAFIGVPRIAITGGGGTGATATVSGMQATAAFTSGFGSDEGSGYVVGDVLTLSPGLPEFVRVVCSSTSGAFIRFGVGNTTTATTTDILVTNIPEYFDVDGYDSIAVLQQTGSAVVNITTIAAT
jgi:hypothetical protein